MNFVLFIAPVSPWKCFKQGYYWTQKPWLSDGMKKNTIKTKNKLYRWYKKTGSAEHESIYKQNRNNLTNCLLQQGKVITRHFLMEKKSLKNRGVF